MALYLTTRNLEYCGEGNAGLIVRLKKERKVLRLIKRDIKSKDQVMTEKVREDLENQIEFIKNVMTTMLGGDMVFTPEIIFLHADDVKFITESVNQFRPAHRMHKGVKVMDTYALLYPDFCYIHNNLSTDCTNPIICIEIKPKQGFISKEKYHSTSEGSKLCRYCMVQYDKLKKKDISRRSGYCPMDLFSGCKCSTMHAIKELLATPQNNLRIFKDQKLVYSEEKGDIVNVMSGFFGAKEKNRLCERLCELVTNILLQPSDGDDNQRVIIKEKYIKHCVNSHHDCSKTDCIHKLPPGCVLDKILKIQLLQLCNSDDIYRTFLELQKCENQQAGYIGCLKQSQIPSHVGETEKMPDETDYHFISRKIWEFLVSLTLKDCSIMVAIQHHEARNIEVEKNLIVDEFGNKYLYSIAIADLDIKPPSKVEKYFHDTQRIVQSYTEYISHQIS